MLKLSAISKRYGAVQALRSISMTAPKGEIVGLLGVNGAGKSTALNVMTGYMPPSEGTVTIDGHDMQREARICKRMIGYLPEQPPLYDEMTVTEYLTFVSRLREVQPSAIAGHVREIIGLCGLDGMRDRMLGALSKGFRQRAGFAQALCGDPPLLILDEPTVGLDPRQVTELRSLIRELGETHTIIFSSHILPEVQQLCSQVVILHHGRVVHEARMNALTGEPGEIRLLARIAANEQQILPALRGLTGVRRVEKRMATQPGVTEVTLTFTRETDATAPHKRLFHLLTAMNAPLLALMPEPESLEEIFLRFTAEDEGTEA